MRAGLRIPLALPNTGAVARARRRSFVLRSALFVLLLLFLYLQIHSVFTSIGGGQSSLSSSESANETAAAILAMVPQVLHKYLAVKPKNATGGQNTTIGRMTINPQLSMIERHEAALSEISKQIRYYNTKQTVINEEIFGPLQNDSVVIVVQVHTRITYLRHLIISLAQAQGISNVLIVFSHDYYDEDINDLVQSVDFCKVMQIFYPFSIQTHPNVFPGEDPKDCPRNLNREQAILRKCNNALHPDSYGHYREAKFCQTKHHWWWKANRVFDQLDVTKYFTGPVVFLEEDHYVAPDFLHVLGLMQESVKTHCSKCSILSLGTYLKTYNYYGNSKQAEITPWISSKHNMGMVFNRTIWEGIRMCSPHFCTYDDYNWDWSLQHVSHVCLRNKLHAIVLRGPRVFHIGECGVHHKKKNCESAAMISKVQQVLKTSEKYLFPSKLSLVMASPLKKQKLRKGNGGWGDTRDHALCYNMTLRLR
ncbi:alpha-1,6-mannosyl-glycoprotein 2-beta-N-acetylglucosaminyltransferase isoform X2 [Ctenocephalides felis]|uniref:alpha-1,6-mannosyl-glycoprotein 2-beta-N-acetylglucosaminyltransferase isoform X2 n=1 Tax=Ctenocephalides felis TaxID=7515 RepID=UPI000E6E2D07|nr:alpha-1,6-mannosyl-glycoprotein 2-beta-N-acetylglucosaminyltransferase isoform X2 [Ctenocephalides felis]